MYLMIISDSTTIKNNVILLSYKDKVIWSGCVKDSNLSRIRFFSRIFGMNVLQVRKLPVVCERTRNG